MENKTPEFGEIESDRYIHEVMDDMVGCWRTQLVFVAVKSNLLKFIADFSSVNIEKLSQLTGINHEGLSRLISALNSLNYIAISDEMIKLTPKGQILLNKFPNAAIMWGTTHYRALGQLYESLINDMAMGTTDYDQNFFYYLDSDVSLAETHQKAFAEYANLDYPKIAENLPITAGEIVADLGGGLGILLNFAMKSNPEIHGIVIDLPKTINLAKHQAINDNIEFIPGDFFKPLHIPKKIDVVLMSRILHDWEDSKAIQILECAKSLISPNGKICVIEHIRPSELEKDTVALLNLHMYCIQKGKERTLTDFEFLFKQVGLMIKNVDKMDFLSIITVGI